LRGQNIEAVLNQVLEGARANPIPAPYSPTSQRPVNDWILLTMLQSTVAPGWITFGWTEEIIVKAVAGDASLARLLYDSSTGGPNYYEGGDQHRTIVCEDSRWSQWPRTNNHVRVLTAVAQLASPRFGKPNVFQGPVQCVGYPVSPVEPPPLPSQAEPGQPPALVIVATQDANTPPIWGQRVAARQPAGTIVLTREGPGHIGLDKSDCVQDTAGTYLVSGTLPAPGAICPTDPDKYYEQPVPPLGPSAARSASSSIEEVEEFLRLNTLDR
jgi:hypothetical protein